MSVYMFMCRVALVSSCLLLCPYFMPGHLDEVEVVFYVPVVLQAFLLRPCGASVSRLPAVLWLHSHDDVKGFGKEKVADGGALASPASRDRLPPACALSHPLLFTLQRDLLSTVCFCTRL